MEALEPFAGTVVRIVYNHGGCPGPCTRTVQETTAGSTTGHTLLRIPFLSADSQQVAAQVVRADPTVTYVPLYGNLAAGAGTQHTVIFRTTDGGISWQRLADPCGAIGQAVHDTGALAAAPGGYLAALCLPRAGSGPTFVLTSPDYGSSWSEPRLLPGGTRHHLSLIAVASPGRLVAATAGAEGSGRFTYRLAVSTDGGSHWSTAVTGNAQITRHAPSAVFLGFEDSRTGRWISDNNHIWATHDGGLHWTRQAFP